MKGATTSVHLSPEALSLWAKKGRDGSLTWLPLVIHMADSAGVAGKLWDAWLPDTAKRLIASHLRGEAVALLAPQELMHVARQFFTLLCAVHDLGKAIQIFQSIQSRNLPSQLDAELLDKQIMAGLPMPPDGAKHNEDKKELPHALATLQLLLRAGCHKSVCAVLGAHHGMPATTQMVNDSTWEKMPDAFHFGKRGKADWQRVQQEVLDYALSLAGFGNIGELPEPDKEAQVLLSGLVITADWVASNEAYFPYIGLHEAWHHLLHAEAQKARLEKAWEALKLPTPWNPNPPMDTDALYTQRFAPKDADFHPYPIQQLAAQIAQATLQPGIMLIEAMMGQGKTEAALAAAELMAQSCGCSGLFFALPTQATSNGIYPRVADWAVRLDGKDRHSIRLAHGKAQFNQAYRGLMEGSSNVGVDEKQPLIVHTWFEGHKKALLADFVVGTIDQLLMAALRQKHVMLKHLGLAGKVVIIDEVHAYDVYMSRYLMRALEWLGAYGVPVIVLSATLPAAKRQELIDAYLAGRGSRAAGDSSWRQSRAYPLITWTDGDQVHSQGIVQQDSQREVLLHGIASEALVDHLQGLLVQGGCIGIIMNTVRAAQALAGQLQQRFPEDGTVELLHAAFLAPDRAEKERLLLEELGKPGPETKRPKLRIIVGTQVLEQSLDIDFDLLVTQLCPMDLLLQRIGRLHRHDRPRPDAFRQARCLILDLDEEGFDPGSRAVYGSYALMRTKALLPASLRLPSDIPELVQDAYDDQILPDPLPEGYREARAEWLERTARSEGRAQTYLLTGPSSRRKLGLESWLEMGTDCSELCGEAAVRDGGDSIEVLLLQQRQCAIHFVPWQEDGRIIPHDQRLEPELARLVACQQIRLPKELCSKWNIEETIGQLEAQTRILKLWQDSPWLKGQLILLLDESLSACLNGYRISYNRATGLTHSREGK